MEQASQADASSSTVATSGISEVSSIVQYSVLKNDLKIIQAKLNLIKALNYERKADVQCTSDLDSTLRQYVALALMANLNELAIERTVEGTGSIELLTRMDLPPRHKAHVPEDRIRKVLELLDKIIEPNLRRVVTSEKIKDLIKNINYTVFELQERIANFNDLLISQAQELKSKEDAVRGEYARLKRKIELKLAKINLLKTLSCNLLGLGNIDFLKNEKYGDKIGDVRKPLTFHTL
ncbi:uncharacterized protein [Anabrus simplex]|uniref:uncharacterized protein n=1 Tax=Anabrus simplex TaxID=316456 RepID=UPI0035A334BB